MKPIERRTLRYLARHGESRAAAVGNALWNRDRFWMVRGLARPAGAVLHRLKRAGQVVRTKDGKWRIEVR